MLNVLILPIVALIASASPQSDEDCETFLSPLSHVSATWLAEPSLEQNQIGELRGQTNQADAGFFTKIEEIARKWRADIQVQPFLREGSHLVFALRIQGTRHGLIAAFLDLQDHLGRLHWVSEKRKTEAEEEHPTQPTPPTPPTLPDFQPQRLTVTEWAVKGGAKSLLTGRTQLSDKKPLAFITYYGRPAWAVVLESWAQKPGILSEIEDLVGHRLMPSLTTHLPTALAGEPQAVTLFTGPKGFHQLSQLSEDGSLVLVAPKGTKARAEGVPVVLLPLLPFAPSDTEPTSAPATDTSEPSGSTPPLIDEKEWRLGVEFDTQLNWQRYIHDANRFTDFLLRQVHWSLPMPDSNNRYELFYLTADDKMISLHFAFDQRSENFAVLTIQNVVDLTTEQEREYWSRTAITHRFRGHTYRLGIQPLTLGDKQHERIRVSAAVLARLEIKSQISEEEVHRVLGFLNHATPGTDNIFRSEVQIERRTYRVMMAVDERENVRLVSMQRM